MPSTVVWANRGSATSDSDLFNAAYGANAAAARAVVDNAVADRQAVIDNFNYAGVGTPGNAPLANTYIVEIFAVSFVDGAGQPVPVRGAQFFGNDDFGGADDGIDAAGKPYRSVILLDNDAGSIPAAPAAWYFDPVPQDNAEFGSLKSRFDSAFTAGGPTRSDLYRTITHELGHGFGIAIDPALAVSSKLVPAGTDAIDGVSPLRRFNGASGAVTLTENGGGHVYEVTHPFDLLNAGRAVPNEPNFRRQLISDLNANFLKDAYGFTVVRPSDLETFLIDPNAATGEIVVNHEPVPAPGISGYNKVTFTALGTTAADSKLEIRINDVVEQFAVTASTPITYRGRAGFTDQITVVGSDTFQGTPAGENFTVQPLAGGRVRVERTNLVPFGLTLESADNIRLFSGAGDDVVTVGDVSASGGLRNLFVFGGAGNDLLDGSAQGSGTLFLMALQGDAGDDTLIGGVGRDGLGDTGGGNYQLFGNGGDDDLFVAGPGNNTLDGGAGDDQLQAYPGTGVNRLIGGAGNDSLFGGAGNDFLFGGDGGDSLFGGLGVDQLDGGAGNDSLYGGNFAFDFESESSPPPLILLADGVADQLTGGDGADAFLDLNSDLVADSLLDFNTAQGDTVQVVF